MQVCWSIVDLQCRLVCPSWTCCEGLLVHRGLAVQFCWSIVDLRCRSFGPLWTCGTDLSARRISRYWVLFDIHLLIVVLTTFAAGGISVHRASQAFPFHKTTVYIVEKSTFHLVVQCASQKLSSERTVSYVEKDTSFGSALCK